MAIDASISRHVRLPAHLRDPLRERGFVLEDRAYRCDGLSFAADGQWLVLGEQADGQAAWAPSCGLGEPGLWKWIQTGGPPHRVFEIPLWAVSEQAEEDRFAGEGPAPFAKLLDWALATRPGLVPLGWPAPASALVESWLPRGALTVQSKGLVRQGELILGPERWAVRIPVLPQLPADLPAPRRRALDELVLDAQRHWAMARLGVLAEAGASALVAEVDFTGAPHCELLFSAGLDVLRHVVAWMADSVAVLADPSVAIACLAPGGLNTTEPSERNTP